MRLHPLQLVRVHDKFRGQPQHLQKQEQKEIMSAWGRLSTVLSHLAGQRQPAGPPAQSYGLSLSKEVEDALARGGPVVALESTIITHGE